MITYTLEEFTTGITVEYYIEGFRDKERFIELHALLRGGGQSGEAVGRQPFHRCFQALPLVVVSSMSSFAWLIWSNACNKCCNPRATIVATGCNGYCTRFATTVAKGIPYPPHHASHACRNFIGKAVGKEAVSLSDRFRLSATFADGLFLSAKR